jgi:hypothetical protein
LKAHSEVLLDCKTNYQALKEMKQVCLGDACDEAFGNLKKLLTTSPMLAQSNIAMLFDVYSDASGIGLGGV